jgi:MoaA/NifB/PqqE/SkfB family radical SAM enzyme
VSVTNVCNATCDFCTFAHDKGVVKDRRWIDRAKFAEALPILYRRGVRYLAFQGGEPLLHPAIDRLVAEVRASGMRPALITNGWLLPEKVSRLITAGLGTLLISIDSHSLALHEKNRGLKGVGARIREGIANVHRHGIPAIAVVTVNHLVEYEKLPDLLNELGFDAVSFSYPRKEPFGSSSLVYGSESDLVDFTSEQLLAAIDAIKALKSKFTVMNPSASLDDIKRYARGEPQKIGCVGGRKYFYLDWNLDLWRCEAWHEPLGSVFDLDRIEDRTDRCTACIQNCYRDTSVLMHAGVAVADAAAAASRGRIGTAFAKLAQPGLAASLGAVIEEAGVIRRLAHRGTSRP